MTIKLDSASVSQYLIDHPEFFLENPILLTQIKLSSTRTDRAISLQERQMEVMREKHKTLECQMADLMCIGRENDGMTRKYQCWTRSLLLARNNPDCANTLVHGLQTIFDVPHVTLRLWQTDNDHAWFAQPVSDETKKFANSLHAPYCGLNNHFEVLHWLEKAECDVQSTVILPLRIDAGSNAFGLLVLGSPDPQRYMANMATDFLTNISETASAALAGLLVGAKNFSPLR
jgi:uncharacterized protein YigA (DUF484 family)